MPKRGRIRNIGLDIESTSTRTDDLVRVMVDNEAKLRVDSAGNMLGNVGRRGLSVTKYRVRNVWGELSEYTCIDNGRIQLYLDTGYGACWTPQHNFAAVGHKRVLGCGSDYWHTEPVDGQVQAFGPFTDFSLSHPAWTILTEETWFREVDGVEVPFDPAGLTAVDDHVCVRISRLVGTGTAAGGASGSARLMTLDTHKTPMVRLTSYESASQDVGVIYSNDSGEPMEFEGYQLVDGASLCAVGKVIEYDGADLTDGAPNYIKLWVYIDGKVGDGRFRVYVFPGAKDNGLGTATVAGMRSGWGAKDFVTQGNGVDGPAITTGWNYFYLDARRLCKGTNLLLFRGYNTSNFSFIACSESTANVRNKAYGLYSAYFNYVRVISHTYKLYRDRDVIEMTPSLPAAAGGNTLWAAPARGSVTYNLTHTMMEFDKTTPEVKMQMPFRRVNYIPVTPDRVTMYSPSGTPIVVVPGTSGYQWVDYDGGWRVSGGYTRLQLLYSSYSYNPYDSRGFTFYRADNACPPFTVKFVQNQPDEPRDHRPELHLEKFADPPWWYGRTGPEPTLAEYNDIVYYMNDTCYPGDICPTMILDISKWVGYY